jgi:hypothetical protein
LTTSGESIVSFPSRSAQSAKNSMFNAARGTTRATLPISSEPLSAVSTAAISGSRSRIACAKRLRTGWRPSGPSAAHAGNAARAAATAASTSSAPAAATSARCRPSIGERTSMVRRDATRLPPMECAVDTSMPATLATFISWPPESS